MSRFYDPNTLEVRLRQKIVFLKNKLEEIEAIEKYFERNFLFELTTITRQKKRKTQQKLKDSQDIYKVYFLLSIM
jgi:CRISPR/Cas system CMR subunit Cmr6 (Cas7 group RAMP superfamily)